MVERTYRNIIFDAGNVLVDLDIPKAERLFQEWMNLTFLDANGQDLQTFHALETGHIDADAFIRYFIQRSKVPIQAAQIRAAWNAMLVDIPLQRLEMLMQLRKNHRVFILSNTNEIHLAWVASHLQQLCGKTDFGQFVDRAFYSCRMGMRKPDPNIYLKMLTDGNINPAESIFFDDHLENIEAANSVGLHGILVDPREEIIELVPKYLT